MRRRHLPLTETERVALVGILLIFLIGLMARQRHLRSMGAPNTPIQQVPQTKQP